MAFLGTFPVGDCVIKINTSGSSSTMTPIAEVEEMGISIEGNVEKWNVIGNSGWQSALMTGKGYSFEMKGKRSVGDAGNDYVAGLAWKTGRDCNSTASIEFPDKSKLEFACVVDVTNIGGGSATAVAPLEFTLHGVGKPTWTDAPGEPS